MQVQPLGPLDLFTSYLGNAETEWQYVARLGYFFNYLELPESDRKKQAANFVKKARADPQWSLSCIIGFINHYKQKVAKNEISPTTLTGYFNAIQSFYEANDLQHNWKRIRRGLPEPRFVADDRAPRIDEIRKLCEHKDRRVRIIVLLMCSAGIRVGAFSTLKWKNVTAINNADFLKWKKQQMQRRNGNDEDHHNISNGNNIVITKEDEQKIIAAKLDVYPGENERYYSFMTPECYAEIQAYMDYRRGEGETITGESWLIRDIWATTNVKYAANRSLAKYPKKLAVSAIKKLLNRAIWQQGLRQQPLEQGKSRRHEWKQSHAYRKYFKTHAEPFMRPANVERLMGHSIGVSDSYLRTEEFEVLEDYLRAVDSLTINHDAKAAALLQRQVAELTEKSTHETNAIVARLTEKENEINQLKEQQKKTDQELQLIFQALKMAQGRADLIEEQRKIAANDPQWRKAMIAAEKELKQTDLMLAAKFDAEEEAAAELLVDCGGGGEEEGDGGKKPEQEAYGPFM